MQGTLGALHADNLADSVSIILARPQVLRARLAPGTVAPARVVAAAVAPWEQGGHAQKMVAAKAGQTGAAARGGARGSWQVAATCSDASGS